MYIIYIINNLIYIKYKKYNIQNQRRKRQQLSITYNHMEIIDNIQNYRYNQVKQNLKGSLETA